MFRRTKSESSAADVPADGSADAAPSAEQKKGQATPKRRDAEAAARARAKASASGGVSPKQERTARAENSRAIRQGIKEGDERYLPARDRGPVRRFVRDYVDHRLNMAEFAIPLLFISLLSSALGHAPTGTAILNATFVIVVLDCAVLRWRMRRELARRFPGASYKGTTFYAYTRALQFRFLRLPKTRAKIGQKLPETY